MKISFITTVFNEKETIKKFLDSLFSQTKLPNEIIIVDGESTDNTLSAISNFQFPISNKKVKIIIKKGNRSVGRNEAIKHATGDIIVCSDSGNILDNDWIKNITKPFKDLSVDVVAGYYKGKAKNIFQKCLIPYVLVMPDKVDPDNFLPATRSVAFKKSIWKKVEGFDERLSHNEDYVFAHKLKEKGARIVFAKDAIVNWMPRNTFKEAFIMFFRFAFGDAEANIWRTNVLLLFARYSLGFYFIFLSFLYKSFVPLAVIFISIIFYVLWSIKKNYKYVKDKKAFTILPALQFTADTAVLSGTIVGVLKRIINFKYFSYVKQNKILFVILTTYLGVLLLTLNYGIPNKDHPFPYMMDEWHQLQAVANTYRYGTPNVFGSANGTMFHFLFSGLYLIPFMVLKIIDPFALQIDNWVMRERVFEILRLQTAMFGVLSIFVLYKISELLKISKKLAITLFVITPVWLILSSFFKYDIALMFWIHLSMWSFLYFGKFPTNRNFVMAAIPPALAFSVKVSAIPLLLIYLFSYFWFGRSWKKNVKYFFVGVGVFIGVILLFGIPDTVFGKGNLLFYFWENAIYAPTTVSNFNLGMPSMVYIFTFHYFMIFGHGLMLLFVLAVLFRAILFIKEKGIKNVKKYKFEIFIYFSFLVFVGSLIRLQIFATSNRSLVLLPFFVLIIGFAFKELVKISKVKLWSTFLIFLIIGVQFYESFAWTYMKIVKSPQQVSSEWIMKNISQGQTIGLENIPIYQGIPDIFLKEFYFGQYKIAGNYRYKYEVIDAKSKNLPSIIIVTNDQVDSQIYHRSEKKDLVKRLEKEKYKRIAVFTPDFTYYKILGTKVDYSLSYITSAPVEIAVYMK